MYQVLNFRKIGRANIYDLTAHTCLVIRMNLHFFEDNFLQINFKVKLSQALHFSRDQSILDDNGI